MPLYPTSFFIPSSVAIPFLMEDTYMRGGWHCVATVAERDAIPLGARKAGMRVYVSDTGDIWTLEAASMTTWILVPQSAVRNTLTHAPGSLAAGASADFTFATGKSAFILNATVTHVDLTLEGFSTSARNDSNPYKFVSYTGHLSDDGSSVLEDSSLQFNRRYAIMSNLEATPAVTTYWRITNGGASSVSPTISVTYLTLEQ